MLWPWAMCKNVVFNSCLKGGSTICKLDQIGRCSNQESHATTSNYTQITRNHRGPQPHFRTGGCKEVHLWYLAAGSPGKISSGDQTGGGLRPSCTMMRWYEVVESWEPMWYPWTDAVPPLGLGNPGEAKDGVFPPSSGQQDVFDKAGIGWGSDVRGDLGTWLPSLGMKVWQHVKLHENYLSFDLTPTKLNNCNPSVSPWLFGFFGSKAVGLIPKTSTAARLELRSWRNACVDTMAPS